MIRGGEYTLLFFFFNYYIRQVRRMCTTVIDSFGDLFNTGDTLHGEKIHTKIRDKKVTA